MWWYLSLALLILVYTSVYFISYSYFVEQFYKSYDVKSPLAQKVFSASMSVAAGSFFLLVLELRPSENSHFLEVMWKANVAVIVLFIYVVLPVSLAIEISNCFGSPIYRRIMKFVLIPSFLYLTFMHFLKCGEVAGIPRDNFAMTAFFSRSGLFGVVFVAGIAGHASVSFPVNKLLWRSLLLEKSTAAKIESQFVDAVEELSILKSKLACLQCNGEIPDFSHSSDSEQQKQVFFQFKKLSPKAQNKTKELVEEVEAATNLVSQMHTEITTIQERQNTEPAYGIKLIFNKLSSGYLTFLCLYRIVMSAANVGLNRFSPIDQSTAIINGLASFVGVDWNLSYLIHLVSFITIGVLVWMAVKCILEYIELFFQRAALGRPSRHISNAVAVLSSAVALLHFSSVVLLLRAYLPYEKRESVSATLGPHLHLQYLQFYFDLIFFLANILTVPILILRSRSTLLFIDEKKID